MTHGLQQQGTAFTLRISCATPVAGPILGVLGVRLASAMTARFTESSLREVRLLRTSLLLQGMAFTLRISCATPVAGPILGVLGVGLASAMAGHIQEQLAESQDAEELCCCRAQPSPCAYHAPHQWQGPSWECLEWA